MTHLKSCPFCGSDAEPGGGTIGNITVTSARCSNVDCIAAFKSVDPKVWNMRPEAKTVKDKLADVASKIGIEYISLDQLISAYLTIWEDRKREETVRRAELDAMRERVAKQTADEVKTMGWFSVERLRGMSLLELSDLLRD
jgi:hypothetical protein